MWILAIIILLLIWGNLSKKSASHPLNSACITSTLAGSGGCGGSTAGDCMTKGCTISAGVPEPLPKAVTCQPVAQPILSRLVSRVSVGLPKAPKVGPVIVGPMQACNPPIPVHVSLPVDPPPISITRPVTAQPLKNPIVATGANACSYGGPTDCQVLQEFSGGGGGFCCLDNCNRRRKTL